MLGRVYFKVHRLTDAPCDSQSESDDCEGFHLLLQVSDDVFCLSDFRAVSVFDTSVEAASEGESDEDECSNHSNSILIRGERLSGSMPAGTVTMHSDSERVTGQPSKAGKMAETIAGGQDDASSLPMRYVMR